MGNRAADETIKDQYVHEIRQWRADRLEKLLEPSGWLSLAGFHWLSLGTHRLGSAQDNDIVIPKCPPYLGVLTLTAREELYFVPEMTADVTIDGGALTVAQIFSDGDAQSYQSTIKTGFLSLVIIKRDGRMALRIRDDSPALITEFSGLDYFEIDPAWRINARWDRVEPGTRKLELRRRMGNLSVVDSIGRARFLVEDQSYELSAYLEHPGSLPFFVFRDLTCSDFSHPNGRFLHASIPEGTEIIIDFNKAQNPPSAFTPFANCPSAPVQNHLSLRITAGEKRYQVETSELK